MPRDTLIFLAFTLLAFGGFAGALAYADATSKAVRRRNHPLPGE